MASLSDHTCNVVLATYSQAAEVAAAGEWWRVALDEPHAKLTAVARSGAIDISSFVGRAWNIHSFVNFE